jgi:hypothetical protein
MNRVGRNGSSTIMKMNIDEADIIKNEQSHTRQILLLFILNKERLKNAGFISSVCTSNC